jgi:hypothetical protein
VVVLPMMVRGEAPEAVSMVGPKEVLTHLALSEDEIPMHFQPAGGKHWALIALVASDSQISAAIKGVTVSPLSYDPMTDDLVWARIDGGLTPLSPPARDLRHMAGLLRALLLLLAALAPRRHADFQSA